MLGMNIVQITGEGIHSQLWFYFTIAVVLTTATFGEWVLSDDKVGRWLRDILRKTKAAKGHNDPETHRLKNRSSP
jgi:hypothetical protein